MSLIMLQAGTATFAQAPTQPSYDKVVFKRDGNTYVQKSLPLYLKFSTTPGGENHAMKSKISAKYADPMYLDTEGINYIRSKWAVDPETGKTAVPQQEVMYELYADGLAPVSRIKFHDAPRYAARGKVYYGKGLNVTLTSTDGVSGVAKTQYSLNSSS